MSSPFSLNNGVPLCQRCKAPLAVGTLLCPQCGYSHALLPDGSTQQRNQQPPMWNSLPRQSFLHDAPQRDQSQQGQAGGLLTRYPAQREQRNRYLSPSSQPQAAPSSFSSQVAVNGLPTRGHQQPEMVPPASQFPQIGGNSSGDTRQSSVLPLHRENFQGGIQSTSSISIGPSTPPSAYTQNLHFFEKNSGKTRQFNVGRIVGVLLLLLVVIGGSFLASTFFLAQKSMHSATNSLPSHSPITTSSVPQGIPLFQDNFLQNTNGWSIQSYPGEFSVILGNGALKLESENNKLLWELVPGGKSYGDFQLSVDALLSKGSQENGYGVYIRSTVSQNISITSFYRFELYGDSSFAVFKGTTDAKGTVTASRLVDYTNSTSLEKQGILNRIMIKVKGSLLQFIVNGQTVSTVSDSAYTSGSVALFVSNLPKASPGAEATFSHLAIYPLV